MNSLSLRSEFERVLGQYHVSPAAQAILQRARLAFLVGPSSSGRNTIIRELLKTGKYHYIVSDTTRKPRENNGVMEQNGREYWFRTEAELLQDLQNGAFLEAAIIHDQQVSGISIRELQTAADEGKIAINEIEVVGAANIHAAEPQAHFFFVLPPSFQDWMGRLNGRGPLENDELKRRMKSALVEIETALSSNYYEFVVNINFVDTAMHIDAAIRNGSPTDDQFTMRKLARDLLQQTEVFLQST